MPDLQRLFDDIDTMEADRFAAYLDEDVVFRFGNADPVHGRAAVRDVWAGFCATVDGVRHTPVGRWEVDGGTTIAEADVTYTRKDASEVTVPVVTIFRTGGDAGLIADYRVFIDLAPLFA